MEPTRVKSADSYLELVSERMRSEGFTVMNEGNLGDYPLRLVATRKGGKRLRGETIHIVILEHDDMSVRGLESLGADALVSFAYAALESHSGEATGLSRLLHGPTYVVPVVLSKRGPSDELARAVTAMQLERNGTMALPVVVDLDQGAVHMLRRQADVTGGTSLLPYLWWLVAPRLIDRPRARTSSQSIRRIAGASGAAAAAMFVGAYFYVQSQPAPLLYLTFAADAETGQIAYTYHDGRGVAGPEDLVVLDPTGDVIARSETDPTLYFCGFSGATATFRDCDTDGCTITERATTGGHTRTVMQLRRWSSCPSVSPAGTRAAFDAFDEDDEHDEHDVSTLFLRDADGTVSEFPGSATGDAAADWFPDGKRVVINAGSRRDAHLVEIELASGRRTKLTEPGNGDLSPAVAPTGKLIAFYRRGAKIHGARDRYNTELAHLALLDTSDGSVQILVQDVCYTTAPAWASDQAIVYGKMDGRFCNPFVYDIEAGEIRQLAHRER